MPHFGALCRDDPLRAIKIKLLPPHGADLAGTLEEVRRELECSDRRQVVSDETLAAEAAQEDADVSYAADIGVFIKARLAIDKAGIEWRSRRIALRAVRGVRDRGAVKKFDDIPTGTNYLIAWSSVLVVSCGSGACRMPPTSARRGSKGQHGAAIESGSDAVRTIGIARIREAGIRSTVKDAADAIDPSPASDSNDDHTERAVFGLCNYRHTDMRRHTQAY